MLTASSPTLGAFASPIQFTSMPASNSCPKPEPIPNDLQRMAQLLQLNDRLFVELRALRAQVREAWSYLLRPDSNQTLGLARLQRLQAKRSGTLALLRSYRAEAQALLVRYPSA